MQCIKSSLGRSQTGYERFKMDKQEKHILLFFPNDNNEFGYLRSGVGKILAPLLQKQSLEFEPIVLTSTFKSAIEQANKASEALLKIDINIYGLRQIAKEIGDVLSSGKLWLQKSSHARLGVTYDNPHLLNLKMEGLSTQFVHSVGQSGDESSTSKVEREERLRKMVEEVYTSLDHNRHLDVVESGAGVTRKLLR